MLKRGLPLGNSGRTGVKEAQASTLALPGSCSQALAEAEQELRACSSNISVKSREPKCVSILHKITHSQVFDSEYRCNNAISLLL